MNGRLREGIHRPRMRPLISSRTVGIEPEARTDSTTNGKYIKRATNQTGSDLGTLQTERTMDQINIESNEQRSEWTANRTGSISNEE